ncbi:tRNA pseudouridine(13) synthase TruD [Vibrio palustris]|uniref:tRNA pseudouridine synthase D n=1 Tax=Vibrio palustris TaxID=1918946 RepID=A0A1R4B7W1_9VIBR|nr:tRNA pseudouridine(13) synthase TruD [Vibrio palustris]SJL85010.1 tRNA pseudouridine synthase D [Vibrio palustris]
MTDILSPFAYLCGQPTAKAKLKAKHEHFRVIENLGYELSGHGEHWMVRIRKTGENTSFVANELAKACGVTSKDVSWAGLKDRHAVTEQWFSVYLPGGEEPDLSGFLQEHTTIEVLDTARHHKKLRPGDLQGNAFEVVLSEVTNVEDVLARLAIVKEQGVPNYFGSQRFGREGNNLHEARRWGRNNVRTRNSNKRSMYLSTARSWIFNHILSKRIELGLFEQVIVGDIVQQQNGETTLVDEASLASIQSSVNSEQAVITAALAGDNALPTQGKALDIEQACIDQEGDLMALIRGNRMRHDRRGVSLRAQNFHWSVDNDMITLKFELDSGSFATAITRELIEEIPVERQYD